MYCQISAQISLRAYILHGARHGARDVDCALPAVQLTGGSCAALGGGSARTPRTASWHRAHLHTRPGQLGIAQDQDSSGQLWCCSCARCCDGTIIAEPHGSQLLVSPRPDIPVPCLLHRRAQKKPVWWTSDYVRKITKLEHNWWRKWKFRTSSHMGFPYPFCKRHPQTLIQNLQMYAVFQKLNIYTFSRNIIRSSEPKIITLNEF